MNKDKKTNALHKIELLIAQKTWKHMKMAKRDQENATLWYDKLSSYEFTLYEQFLFCQPA